MALTCTHSPQKAKVESGEQGGDGAADGAPAAAKASVETPSEAALERKSRTLQMLQDLRSEATMGHKLSEVRLWIAGALTALLEVEPGRAAYMKVRCVGSRGADMGRR